MKFFKPEDFDWCLPEVGSSSYRVKLADFVNAKLERKGKVVYGYNNVVEQQNVWHSIDRKPEPLFKYKALLINIEPLEKCTHPKEKIELINTYNKELFLRYLHCSEEQIFKCECGATVQPKEYEVVE